MGKNLGLGEVLNWKLREVIEVHKWGELMHFMNGR